MNDAQTHYLFGCLASTTPQRELIDDHIRKIKNYLRPCEFGRSLYDHDRALGGVSWARRASTHTALESMFLEFRSRNPESRIQSPTRFASLQLQSIINALRGVNKDDVEKILSGLRRGELMVSEVGRPPFELPIPLL